MLLEVWKGLFSSLTGLTNHQPASLMKPKGFARRLIQNPVLFAAACLPLCGTLSAAVVVFDGGAGGTGTDIGTAANWVGDVLPSPATPDTATWDGTVAGPLALSYSGNLTGAAGNAGLIFNLTSGQTSSVSIDSGLVTSALRIGTITLDANSGAFTLGDGADTFNITLGGTAGTTQTFTNNSINTATINSDVVFGLGGGGAHTLVLAGSGNWTMNNAVGNGTGALGLTKTGTGTLVLSGNNTYSGGTTIGTNGGASIIRATSNTALGTGAVLILGNGGSNRLELTGGITLANAINVNGKGATLGQPSSILNVSGNNTLTGTVTVQTGGQHSTIQSDAGLLTLSNAIALTSNATGTRSVLFTGVGNTAVSGAITNGSSSGLEIYKQGTGTLTLAGTNTYTGATTVSAGTLLINGNNSSATGTVTVSNANTTLGGNGTVGGATTLNADTKLSAGAAAGAIGTFTFSNGLNLAAASNDTAAYIFDLGSVGSSDLVVISGGTLDVGTNLSSTDFTFNQLGGFGTGTYTLFDSSATVAGTVDSSIFSLGGGFNGQLLLADSGSNVVLDVTVVPEPAVTLLGGLGLLGILRRRRSA